MSTPAPPAFSLLDQVHLPGALRVPRVVTVVSPAAGADWSTKVPPGVIWELQTLQMRLVTSATVANRVARIVINDGSVNVAQLQPAAVEPAAGDLTYVFARQFGSSNNTGNPSGQTTSFPSIPLLGAWSIGSATINIDATDQYSAIVLYVIELRPPLYIDPAAIPVYS
jgi:hypothetical protein